MGIRIGMLVLWLCSCAAVSSDPPRDDGGNGNGNGNGNGGVDIGINRSGTRIKMKVLNTPDGAKVFQGSYDTLRNEDCSFQIASDSMTRCLPYFPVVATTAGSYADAACTAPVAAFYGTECSPPKYVAVQPTTPTCAYTPTVGPKIYARGAAYSTHYQKDGATCTGPHPSYGATFYGITGAEIPPSSFQMATTAIE